METDGNTESMDRKSECTNDEAATTAIISTANHAPKPAITSVDEVMKAREWFTTLSVEDKVVALGFALDRDFLASSRVAARLSSATGGNLTTDGRDSKGQYQFYRNLGA